MRFWHLSHMRAAKSQMSLLKYAFIYTRPLDKSVKLKFNFLISQSNHVVGTVKSV